MSADGSTEVTEVHGDAEIDGELCASALQSNLCLRAISDPPCCLRRCLVSRARRPAYVARVSSEQGEAPVVQVKRARCLFSQLGRRDGGSPYGRNTTSCAILS